MSNLEHVDSEYIISRVENRQDFIRGRTGTIISLGCYSECWDVSGREITKSLIAYFLKLGNPVQFATKRYVASDDIIGLQKLIQWEGQLCIFISSVTITHWQTVERGTDSPQKRFSSFELIKKLGIPTYLYLKPILKGVTIKDLDNYKNIVREYAVSGVVVGSHFISNKVTLDNKIAPIGGGIFRYNSNNDEVLISTELKEVTKTYSESTQVIDFWRENV
ncbi:hypothetical protein ACFQW4_02615 [Pantoea sp. GCM10028869]|uniref:hypothetical protein n=1 Tax=Pantoea sp. GCM10028869 TaxID=3273417 RepID=UPI003621C39B